MPITVKCQECGKTYNVPDSAAGKTGSCQQCKKPIEVPNHDSLPPLMPIQELAARDLVNKKFQYTVFFLAGIWVILIGIGAVANGGFFEVTTLLPLSVTFSYFAIKIIKNKHLYRGLTLAKLTALGWLGLIIIGMIAPKNRNSAAAPQPSSGLHTAAPPAAAPPAAAPPAAAPPAAAPPAAQTPIPIDSIVKDICENELGPNHEVTVKYGPRDSSSPGIINIRYHLGDQWSESSAKRNIVSDSKKIFEKLYMSPDISSKVDQIFIVSTSNFTDKYGNPSKNQAGRVGLARATAAKINWKNILNEQFQEVLRSEGMLVFHPSIASAE